MVPVAANAVGRLQIGIPVQPGIHIHRAGAAKNTVDDTIKVVNPAGDAAAEGDANTALHPVGLIGGHAQRKLVRRHLAQHVGHDLFHPGHAGQRSGLVAAAFRVGHDAEKIGAARQRRVIIHAGKIPVIIAAVLVVDASRHRHAQLLAVVMQRLRQHRDEARKARALIPGQVFKIDLPTDEVLHPRHPHQRAYRAVARARAAQQPLRPVAGKAGVDDQGHHGHTLGPRNRVQPGGHRSVQLPVAVEGKTLGSENSDAIGVRLKALHGGAARDRVKKHLGRRLGQRPKGHASHRRHQPQVA